MSSHPTWTPQRAPHAGQVDHNLTLIMPCVLYGLKCVGLVSLARWETHSHVVFQHGAASASVQGILQHGAASGFVMWLLSNDRYSTLNGCWFATGHVSWWYRIPALLLPDPNGPNQNWSRIQNKKFQPHLIDDMLRASAWMCRSCSFIRSRQSSPVHVACC